MPAPAQPAAVAPGAFWPSLWIVVALFAAKLAHWSLPSLTLQALGDYVRDVAASSYADLAFALVLGLLAQAGLAFLGRWPRARRWAFAAYLALGAVTVLYAVASVGVFAYLRSPLTYPLLYLAGDPKSMRSSVGSFVSPIVVMGLLGTPLVYLLLVRVTLARRPWRGLLRGTAVATLLAWVAFGWWVQAGKWSDRDDHLIAASPHWELLASVVTELTGGHTPRLDHPFQPDDLHDFDPPARVVTALPAVFRRTARPRNLILVVMESTAARWMSLYGSPYKTTPRLDAAAAHALVFDNFYCHVGLTANAVAALSLSIFPYMTWREYTLEYPNFPGTSMAGVLGKRGYRTAFVHSGDLEYVGQDKFLKNRGYDVIWDLNALDPSARVSSWGGDERVLVQGILKFIDQDPKRPFYVKAWTISSHHPYEPSPSHSPVDFFKDLKGALPPDDYDLGRYLNTLHDVDDKLGQLLDGLRQRGLADDTLVAITGDHGEAFGQPHETWGHGTRLYQENVNVPFLLWNPRLIPKGRHLRTVGSHVDVNPTLANVLGIPPAPSWQGRSLFDPDRPPRAYFYAANDDYLLGVREGDWKYIYNVTRGRDELYDLSKDPDERHNVAAQDQDKCRRLRQRLSAWKDFAGRQLAQALAKQDGAAVITE